ncbi:tetratricopeptide repeat protein [Brevundimonas goettingensis]|uniref:tetratricopeptide repeat protein n=1 Tax=Brevundimonas goettingensis TaxID=2774190 RepID=UPI001A9EEC3D|nr:site-2 protease family protein [Brevundimonas goettingensis]
MKRNLFGLRRWLCFGCRPVPRGRFGLESLVVSGLMVLAGSAILAAGAVLEPFGYILVAWGGFILMAPVTLAIHELGHAGVAALLGRRVYQINIGTGRAFGAFSIGLTRLAFGRDLGFGYVIQMPLKTASRAGDMAVFAAGAAANLAVAGVMLWLVNGAPHWGGVPAALTLASLFSNLITGAMALVPRTYAFEGQALVSDGRQLLHLLLRRRAAVDWGPLHDAYQAVSLAQAKRWSQAEAKYRDAFARYPDQPGFLGGLMHILPFSKDHEAARACAEAHEAFLRPEREVAAPMAVSWGYAWGMAAWSFVRSPIGDLAAADLYSRRALDLDSLPHPRAIRGALLARTGEPERGLAEMVESFRTLPNPGDQLEFCDFIIAHGLESADLKTPDFEDYAVHLRKLT